MHKGTIIVKICMTSFDLTIFPKAFCGHEKKLQALLKKGVDLFVLILKVTRLKDIIYSFV